MMSEDFEMMKNLCQKNRVLHYLRTLDKYYSQRKILTIDLLEEKLKNLSFLRIIGEKLLIRTNKSFLNKEKMLQYD